MPVVVQQEWMGQRVSVRRVVERAPDGRLLQGDVVGDLVGLDAQTAVIETRTGLIEVPVALITTAKLVPPSTRDELDLQDIASLGLRAEHTLELDGWLLRADAARPWRVNSVLPHAQLRVPLDEALARARDFYAGFDRPALFQIPYPARRLLDAALGERGWTHERPSELLVAPLARVADDDADVQVDAAPDAAWLELSGGDATLLTRHDTVAFASVRSAAGDVLAVARGAVDGAWLGVSTVVVAESARRRGLGRRVTGALAAWAAGHGARRGYLQVEQGNTAARALYAGLGFTVHHSYHYRRAT